MTEYITEEELRDEFMKSATEFIDRKLKAKYGMKEGEYVAGFKFEIHDFGFADSAHIKKIFTKATREFLNDMGPIEVESIDYGCECD